MTATKIARRRAAPAPDSTPPPDLADAPVPDADPGVGRKAHGVDADAKSRNLARLRRVEGQVRGLQRMVEADRYCPDVMVQLSAVHEALRAVGRELMRNHLKHCATAAVRGTPEQADAMYDELVDLMHRHGR